MYCCPYEGDVHFYYQSTIKYWLKEKEREDITFELTIINIVIWLTINPMINALTRWDKTSFWLAKIIKKEVQGNGVLILAVWST